MQQPGESDAPGQADVPVLSVGTPLTTLHYRLTPADALAWEHRPGAAKRFYGRAIFTSLLLGVGLIRALAGRLAVVQAGPARSILAVGLLAFPMAVMIFVSRRKIVRHAFDEVNAPVDVTLEVWPKGLIERRPDRLTPVMIAGDRISEVVITPDHVFVDLGKDVVIIPSSAFATAAERTDFANRWNEADWPLPVVPARR